MKEPVQIRDAIREDVDELIALCAEHALYEQADYNEINKRELLSINLFHPEQPVRCLLAEQGKRIIGYATFMKQFSTWDAGYYIYLDCLYFREASRGQGAGRAMMEQVKQYAKDENCNHIQWQTPSSNARAITFYHKLGATSKDKKRFFWNV